MSNNPGSNGMCRCCASEGTFKDVKTAYNWMGVEEIYFNMLQDCFDITLTSVEDSDNGGICEVCITQLRNAANFKQQVLHTEEQFKQRLERRFSMSSEVKTELENEVDFGSDSDTGHNNDDHTGGEVLFAEGYDEIPIKYETEDTKPKPKKRAAKTAKSAKTKAKKAKTGESSTKQNENIRCNICNREFTKIFNLNRHMRTQHEAALQATPTKLCEECGKVFFNEEFLAKHLALGCLSKTKICVKCNEKFDRKSDMFIHMRTLHWRAPKLSKFLCPLCDEVLQSHEDQDEHLISEHNVNLDYHEKEFFSYEGVVGATEKRKPIKGDTFTIKIEGYEKQMSEMKKQLHNLTTLLKYSNATPFKDRNDAGYICAYCFGTYPDPEILRRHTSKEHNKEKFVYKAGSLASFGVFLDIVDLKCTICNTPKDSLKILTEHLVAVHDKQYYLDITDYFQPFKLTNEQQMNCCLCNEVFHNMKLLMQHMNVHYRNFICPICGAGFVNSIRLNRHENTHGKKKSFSCKHCGQIFAVESKKKAHVNTEHKGIVGDSVCQICKARFKNYYQKTRHMAEVHKVEGIKCDMCEKKFNLKSNLMAHMRNVHLKERPYECTVCSMGFFSKPQMLGHYLATHTNERKFKCDVCGKAYATQNSKRKHMKKNHGISKSNIMLVQSAVTK